MEDKKMIISNEAKTILMKSLASNENDCLKARLQKSCCGTSLYFSLAKLNDGDDPITINGIPVLMDSQTQERAESVTLAVKDGKLVIEDEASSCC